MKMNKKGFTLIELLAVIVILAVIALIAVPQILKVLNEARKSAAEDSAYGVLEAAESYTATYMLSTGGDWNGTMTFTCYNTTGKQCCTAETTAASQCGSGDTKKLDIKGTIPKGGTVVLSATGEASIGTALQVNGFSCSQASGSTKVTCTTP